MFSSIDDIETLKKAPKGGVPKDLIKQINSFVVQRSVSIPVTVDQGGTGRTDNNEFYLGGPSTAEGTWRFRISGTDIVAERLESGSWIQKGGFTA